VCLETLMKKGHLSDLLFQSVVYYLKIRPFKIWSTIQVRIHYIKKRSRPGETYHCPGEVR